MHRLFWTGIAAFIGYLPPALGQGTTVYVGVTYCAPVATGTPSSTNSYIPFFLRIASDNQGQALVEKRDVSYQYVESDGHLTTDVGQAGQFVFTDNNQLAAANHINSLTSYISTSDQTDAQIFALSTTLQSISTTFYAFYNYLFWTNDQFNTTSGSRAVFCVQNNVLLTVFTLKQPAACRQVQVEIVHVPDLFLSSTSTITGGTPTATVSSSTAISSTYTGSSYPSPTTTGAPNCLDRSLYDGTMNQNYLILCNTMLLGAQIAQINSTSFATCINACTAYSTSGRGVCIAVEFDNLASTLNCILFSNIGPIQRGDDATLDAAVRVNGDGITPPIFTSYTTRPTSMTSTSPTATASSSTGSTSVSSSITIPTSSAGSSLTSTSSTPGTSGSMTTMTTTSSSYTVSSPSAATMPSTPASSTSGSATLVTSANPSSTAIITPSGPIYTQLPVTTLSSTIIPFTVTSILSLPPTTIFDPITTITIPTRTLDSIPFITPITFTTTSTQSTSTAPVITDCPALGLGVPLCPLNDGGTFNLFASALSQTCYGVLCSTTLQGTILEGNSTYASNLLSCVSYCSVYNVAIPFGCIGVNYQDNLVSALLGGNNCMLFANVTAEVTGTVGTDAVRLIYPGYPSLGV